MQPNNNRRHSRLACDVPVELVTEQATLPASILDASRSGLRLRVPGQALGVYRLAPLAFVSRQVARLLGVEFEARLHPERLGSLLCKRIRAVRIGQRDASSADVELGCVLNPPFSDEEAVMLGLGLPRVGEDGREVEARLEASGPTVRARPAPPAPTPRAAPPRPSVAPAPRLVVSVPPTPAPARTTPPPAPAPTPPVAKPAVPAAPAVAPTATAQAAPPPARPAGSTRDAWRAYVHPMGSILASPFVGRTEAVTPSGVQIRVQDRAQLQLGGPTDVASTMEALGATYGSEVALRLVDGAAHLWTGPARIEMIEVASAAPHAVTLWLAYGRALRPAELRALELV